MSDIMITRQDIEGDEAVFGLSKRTSKRRGPIATNASAILLGAVAASAIGALAIASLATLRLSVKNAHVQRLVIDDLEIGQITVRAEADEMEEFTAY